MHNERIRENFAAWATGTAVTQEEFDTLDQLVFESVNGDQGGTWAPVDPIVLGGAGLEIAAPAPLVAHGTLHVDGAVTFGETLDVQGSITSVGDIGATGEIEASSANIIGNGRFWGNVDVDGTFNADGAATFGAVSMGSVTVAGSSTFGSLVTFSGGINATGFGSFLNGPVIRERVVAAPDADATFSPRLNGYVYGISGSISGNHVYTLDDSLAEDGDSITFGTDEPYNMEIRRPNLSTIVTISSDGTGDGAGNFRWKWAKIIRIGGVWRVVERGV